MHNKKLNTRKKRDNVKKGQERKRKVNEKQETMAYRDDKRELKGLLDNHSNKWHKESKNKTTKRKNSFNCTTNQRKNAKKHRDAQKKQEQQRLTLRFFVCSANSFALIAFDKDTVEQKELLE
jgi:hypothetical protein